MNEVLNCLNTRRSCRSFQHRQVEEDALQQILEAGLYAPAGKGKQSTAFVVVQDRETVEKLSRMNAAVLGGGGDPFFGAPTVIVVLADRSVGTCVEDGSVALCNLMNAAHALGLGSCWIHRAGPVFASEEGKEMLKKWGVEGDYIGVGHCILGYRDGPEPVAAARREGRIIRV
ncbi:MAG: nitroreductase [Oscillospiraceae bacterium]|nr:nitroreductase [Oscillospiraceae bacterium]